LSAARLIKDPLVHFLLVGLLIFAAFDFIPNQGADDVRVIVVGESQLLPLIMARNPRLDVDAASEYLKSIDQEQHAQLTEDFVREEVMYRQAIALGLDNNNYNARRRLIGQLEYINQALISDSLEVSEHELVAHFEANKQRYFVPQEVTFTHVYFPSDSASSDPSSATKDNDAARDRADVELAYLNDIDLPFHLASSRGEHFLYHRNYVNKNMDEVASHFGASFAASVFAIDQPQRNWLGPFQSEYGYHLVLLIGNKKGYVPPLRDIQAKVLDDLSRIRVKEQLDRLYEEVRTTYEIQIAEPRLES
jgi:hypothetical protein